MIRAIQAGLGFLFTRQEKYLGYSGADQVRARGSAGTVSTRGGRGIRTQFQKHFSED